MADDVKRLNFFDHQFLRAADLSAEQEYHLQMRRRHQRLQHLGIAEGLGLSAASGASRATVGQGSAVDGIGREIVLTANAQTADLSGFSGGTVYVTIAYSEQQTDPSAETGVTGRTRWTEAPVIDITATDPEDPSTTLILGRVVVGADGKITSTDEGVEPNRRRAAGVAAGDLEVRSLTLGDPRGHRRLAADAPRRPEPGGSPGFARGCRATSSLRERSTAATSRRTAPSSASRPRGSTSRPPNSTSTSTARTTRTPPPQPRSTR